LKTEFISRLLWRHNKKRNRKNSTRIYTIKGD
jgi:hypothetical protein